MKQTWAHELPKIETVWLEDDPTQRNTVVPESKMKTSYRSKKGIQDKLIRRQTRLFIKIVLNKAILKACHFKIASAIAAAKQTSSRNIIYLLQKQNLFKDNYLN